MGPFSVRRMTDSSMVLVPPWPVPRQTPVLIGSNDSFGRLEDSNASRAALEANNESSLPSGYAVCPVCGNTYDSANIDEKCAFCQTTKDKFFTF